jgi:hypothetical protein
VVLGNSCGGVLREFRQSWLRGLDALRKMYMVWTSNMRREEEGRKDSTPLGCRGPWRCLGAGCSPVSQVMGWFYSLRQGTLPNTI